MIRPLYSINRLFMGRLSLYCTFELKYTISPRHGAERSRRACARCLKLYVILKLSWDNNYVHLRKIHIYHIDKSNTMGENPFKYTLMC